MMQKLYFKICIVKLIDSNMQKHRQSIYGGCDYSLLLAWLLLSS